MKYIRKHSFIILRLDRNDEIISSLKDVALKENISFGIVSAIGALNKVEIGTYLFDEKRYLSNTYEGDYEIISLLGNISIKDNKPYIHCHISLSDKNNCCIGGHLTSGVISATLECVIEIKDIKINRRVDEVSNLNIFDI